MKKLTVLTALLCIMVLGGCNKESGSSSLQAAQPNTSQSQDAIKEETKPKIEIKSTDKQDAANQMSTYKNTDYYFIEGKEGYVKVLTAARADSKGEIMWDDGQNFCVEVFDGENYYYLLEPTYVQLGTIEVKVYTDMKNNTHNVLLDYSTGAGIEITHFVYDGSNKIFTGETVFKAENINKF